MYSINFTKANEKFCLSLHYNGANSYLFVNGAEIIKFKAKDTENNPYNLCLGNISKDFSKSNIKKQDLMVISMIMILLMLIILMLMMLIRHSQIFNEKEWYCIKNV